MAHTPHPQEASPPVAPPPVQISEVLGVAWFTVLFVLSLGITNGDTPQNSYLLYGLRLANPDFLPGDWFTWEVLHSHPAFSLIVALLAKLGPLTFSLTLGAFLQNATFPVALYVILRVLYDRPLLPWAAALALFAGMDTLSVGSEPWLKSFLGVSSVAGAAMVVAWAFLSRRRLLSAGVAFGVSALIHAHFFVLALPLVVAASLMIMLEDRRSLPWRGLAWMWSGFLTVSALSILQILRFALAPEREEIHWLTASLFPYHVAPWTWNRDPTLMLLGVSLLGVGGLLLRPPNRHRLLEAVMGTTVLMVFGSLFLAQQRLLDIAAQAWPWRLSPLVLVAGLVAGTAAILSSNGTRGSTFRFRGVGFGCLLAGIVVIAGLSRPPVSYVLLVLCLLPAIDGVSRFVCDRWTGARLVPPAALTIAISVAFVPVLVRSAQTSHVEFRAERSQRAVLYEWVREETPPGAVFAIPPTWEKFRLIARRPVVVDWKAVPRHAPARIEWLHRMQAVSGVERPDANGELLDEGYARMDCETVRRLAADYRVRFVVHERPKELSCGQIVYQDDHFRVWDLLAQAAAEDRGGGSPTSGEPKTPAEAAQPR